nr:MAG TPA: hypothetical protein [Caudoviricetes sp.]
MLFAGGRSFFCILICEREKQYLSSQIKENNVV